MNPDEILTRMLECLQAIQAADEEQVHAMNLINEILSVQGDALKLALFVLQEPYQPGRDGPVRSALELLCGDHHTDVRRLMARRETVHERTAALIAEIERELEGNA